MKAKPSVATYHNYPHVISQGVRQNHRWPMIVSNEPVTAPFAVQEHVFVAPGIVDDAGSLTEAGRRMIVRRLVDLAKRSKASYCVVWSPTSCTWFERDGRHRDGLVPPQGNLSNPWAGRDHVAPVEWCWTIRLPDGGEWSHLCVRRITRELVEITPGEPMILADFNEPAVEGLPDPAEGMLARDGSLIPPRTYRGQTVTGIRDDWQLLGPVQPGDEGVVLRNPWPDDVRQACEKVAGMPLPRGLTDAAWRAVDPEHPDVTYVGVQKAA
jgi:hypothetical protein